MYTFRIDLEALTVISIHSNGKENDLNADGEQCADLVELMNFVSELQEQGAYTDMTMGLLHSQVIEAMAAADVALF